MELFCSNIKKFLIFQETETLIKFLIFQEMEHSGSKIKQLLILSQKKAFLILPDM